VAGRFGSVFLFQILVVMGYGFKHMGNRILCRPRVVLAVTMLTLLAALPIPAQDAMKVTGQDFRAVARPMRDGLIVPGEPGYAWNYDTAGEAARAAVAYCAQQLAPGPLAVRCEVTELGGLLVAPGDRLPEMLRAYEERVLQDLGQALASSKRRDLITRLSTIYQKIGRYEESEALLVGLARDGEILARNALAYHWAELNKNLDTALEYARFAVDADPKFFSFHDTLGLVLARLGRLDEAEASLKAAVLLEPHPIALDHYGDLLWMRGKPGAAREQWRQAISASKNILFIQRVEGKLHTGKTTDFVFE